MDSCNRFRPGAIAYLVTGIAIALAGTMMPSVDPDGFGCRIGAIGPDCSRMERYAMPLPVVFMACCDGLPRSKRSSAIERFPNP